MYNEKRMWAYRAPDEGNGGGSGDGDAAKAAAEAAAAEAKAKEAADAIAAEEAKKAGENSKIRQMREDFKTQKTALDEATNKLKEIERGKLEEIDRLKAEKADLEKAATENTQASEKATELEDTLKALVKAKLDALPEDKREQCEKFTGAAPLKDQLDAIDAFAANLPQPKAVGTGGKPPAPGDPNYKPEDPKPGDPEPVDLKEGMKHVGQMGFKQYSQADVDRSLANPGGMSESDIDALLDKKLKEREAAAKK